MKSVKKTSVKNYQKGGAKPKAMYGKEIMQKGGSPITAKAAARKVEKGKGTMTYKYGDVDAPGSGDNKGAYVPFTKKGKQTPKEGGVSSKEMKAPRTVMQKGGTTPKGRIARLEKKEARQVDKGNKAVDEGRERKANRILGRAAKTEDRKIRLSEKMQMGGTKAQLGTIVKTISKGAKPAKSVVKSKVVKPASQELSVFQKQRVADGKVVNKGSNPKGNMTMSEIKAKLDLQNSVKKAPKKLTKEQQYLKDIEDSYRKKGGAIKMQFGGDSMISTKSPGSGRKTSVQPPRGSYKGAVSSKPNSKKADTKKLMQKGGAKKK